MGLRDEAPAAGAGEGRRILLAGAGLGGLAAAVALEQRGFAVHLFERDDHRDAREQGFVVNLENGLRALDELGLGEAVRSDGVPTPALQLLDASGRHLFTFPSRGAYSIARSRLRDLLLEAAGEEKVTWGARCTGFRRPAEDGAGVELLFEDGRVETGDAAVGCDGVRSALRAQLIGDELAYLGVTIVGGEVTGSMAEEAMASRALQGGKLITVSEQGSFYSTPLVASRRIRWSVGIKAPQGQIEESFPEPEDLKEELLRRMGEAHDPIPRMISSTPAEAIHLRPVYDRDPLEPFAGGAVTLLGDAAHPMSPYRGLGANLALQDAVDLARELARKLAQEPASGESLEAGLASYQRILLERGRRAQRLSRQAAKLLHFDHPVPCALRDACLRVGSWLTGRGGGPSSDQGPSGESDTLAGEGAPHAR